MSAALEGLEPLRIDRVQTHGSVHPRTTVPCWTDKHPPFPSTRAVLRRQRRARPSLKRVHQPKARSVADIPAPCASRHGEARDRDRAGAALSPYGFATSLILGHSESQSPSSADDIRRAEDAPDVGPRRSGIEWASGTQPVDVARRVTFAGLASAYVSFSGLRCSHLSARNRLSVPDPQIYLVT